MALARGFSLPPLPYLVALLAGVAALVWGFRRHPPEFDEGRTLALVPWMVAGAGAHVLYVTDALPGALRPFAGTAAVYVTVGVLAGATWLLAATRGGDVVRAVGGVGAVVALLVVGAVALVGLRGPPLRVAWPAAGLAVALALGTLAWAVLARVRPEVRLAGRAGTLAVVGQALDGVSTALGVDLLGFGERSPLSRLLIEFAASLPTADLLGSGWLFALVKVVLACGIVVLLTDYVREDPDQGFLLLGLVAAVGVGPGVHNLLLFSVA